MPRDGSLKLGYYPEDTLRPTQYLDGTVCTQGNERGDGRRYESHTRLHELMH
jgi:hypothetical protein